MKVPKNPRTKSGKAKCVLKDYVSEHSDFFHSGCSIMAICERAKGTKHEELVTELVDIIDGPKKAKFKTALLKVIAGYDYPSGYAIHSQMYASGTYRKKLFGNRVSSALNADECRWRKETLEKRGWTVVAGQRLVPPESWKEQAKFKGMSEAAAEAARRIDEAVEQITRRMIGGDDVES